MTLPYITKYSGCLIEIQGGGQQQLISFMCQVEQNSTEPFTYDFENGKVYEDELYTFIWNGVIYNENELIERTRKKGINQSEVTIETTILKLFMKEGIELFSCVEGKFSIVIWDKLNKILYGVRDHFGIEPLFYTEANDRFFVTNFKQNLEHATQSRARINDEAVQHYFTFQYVPEPLTINDRYFKLKAGHYFIKKPNVPVQQFAYFTPEITPAICSKAEKMRTIRQTIYQCVAERMQPDGKIGAFLSGGIDSTIITTIAKKIQPDIKTFTITYSEKDYSESIIAEKTARALELNHQQIVVTPEKYVQALVEMISYLEEPFADPSAVSLLIGCQEAKKHVDILLSGEGADEMFGGYEIYREFQSLKLFQYIPNILHKPIYQFANSLPKGMKGKSFIQRGITPLEKRYVGNAKIFEEDEKAQLLTYYCPNNNANKYLQRYYERVTDYHPMEKMQYIDWHTWLPGNILFKASRLSNVMDLCIRLPFVDQKMYEIARHLTVDDKISHRTTKAILRESVQDIVPNHILHEKKRGFPVPIRKWLKEELYDWAHEIISDTKTTQFINKDIAMQLLREHQIGKHDHSRKLWTIIVFNVWYDLFVEKISVHELPSSLE